MSWRAREITIAVSLGLHGLVAVAALNAAHEKKARRATVVALAEQQKKKPAPAKKAPPPPPPPVHHVAPRPAAATPTPTPAPTQPAALVRTQIAMSNDDGPGQGGPGIPDGRPASTDLHPKPAAAAVKRPIHVAPPTEAAGDGPCTEPAGKPVPTQKTEIEYTEEARAAGIEGRLVLKVTVDADGNVTDVEVISSVDPALDAAAIAVVKTWRFKPALACGKPVAGGTFTVARRFELGD